MRKLTLLALSLFLVVGPAFAEIQVDEGGPKSQSKSVFFVARYGRTDALATTGNMISKDKVVVWDSTSNDGVTVNTTTTSFDPLVAGVAIDDIPGSSDDNTAANDLGSNNWGRVRAYGRHASVSFDGATPCGVGNTGATLCVSVGRRVATSASAGTASIFRTVSDESATSQTAASRDAFGVLLETPAVTDKVADIFVKAM